MTCFRIKYQIPENLIKRYTFSFFIMHPGSVYMWKRILVLGMHLLKHLNFNSTTELLLTNYW